MPLTRPGVYVTELSLPNISASGARVAAGAFIGSSPQGPTTPVKIESWSQYIARFGGFTTSGSDLPFSVYHYFANGGRTAWVCRVTGTGATNSALNVSGSYNGNGSTTGTVITLTAASPGVWGTGVTVSLSAKATGQLATFDLTVNYGGSIVETFKSLTMLPTDSRFIETVVNSTTQGSTYITASVPTAVKTSVTAGDPVQFNAVNNSALAGGADGAAPGSSDLSTALTKLNAIEGPFLLNCVGWTGITDVNNAMTYAAGRGDVFVVVDPDSASSLAGNVSAVPTYSQSTYGAVYWPRLLMVDPSATSTGATRMTYPGGAVMGLIVATDASRGVFKAPAGLNTTVGGAIALEYRPTDTEYGTLNDNHINAFKNFPGVGIAVFGARTLKRDTIDQYVPARRSLIYLEQALKTDTAFAVFEPNDERLWGTVTTRARRILDNFWQAGGLKGRTAVEAYYVICDSSNNTAATIAAGEVHLDVGVALQAPAEFVVIKIGQWAGGATVSTTV